jgi:hypothetical protein
MGNGRFSFAKTVRVLAADQCLVTFTMMIRAEFG